MSRTPDGRGGMTLYEILIALALLLGAMAVLSQHLSVGTRAAVRGKLQSRAAMLAETKLAEVLTGAEPLQATANIEIPDAGLGWSWTLVVGAGPTADLLDLTLTVDHVDSLGRPDASFTLRRLARDPAALAAAASAAGTPVTGTTASGSVTGGSSGMGSTGGTSSGGTGGSSIGTSGTGGTR